MEDVEFEVTVNMNSVTADYDIDRINRHQHLLVDFDTGSHFLRLTFSDPDDVLSFASQLQEWGQRFKAEYQPEPFPETGRKPTLKVEDDGHDPKDDNEPPGHYPQNGDDPEARWCDHCGAELNENNPRKFISGGNTMPGAGGSWICSAHLSKGGGRI